MRRTFNYYDSYRNRNARISSRIDRVGKFRTETVGRDEGSVNIAASTDSNKRTRLFIDFADCTVTLTGSEARTLYRLLSKHYSDE